MNAALHPKLEENIGWFILIVLAAGCLLVVWPFVTVFLWAAILCFSCWPLYQRLTLFLNNRRTLAAALMTLGLTLIILLPFALVGATLADQVKDLTVAARKWIDSSVPPPPPDWLQKIPLVGKRAVEAWQTHAVDTAKVLATLRRLLEPVSARLLALAVMLAGGLVHLALSLFICFFLFRDGTWAADKLSAVVIRIGGDRAVHLLNLAGTTVRGVVYGVLGTALIQAALGGIGFLIAGVPGAGVLALFTLVFSVVPLGPALVCLPGALWLYHNGHTGWAIFLMVWGLMVGSIDNIIKPWLISRSSPTPILLILFGVLGGAIAFGFIGVFLGPTLLAVGHRVFEEWLSQKYQSSSLVAEPVEEFAEN